MDSRDLDDMIRDERLRETAGGVGRKARAARHALRRRAANEDECPNKHTYSEENTLYNAAGRRICLLCLRDRRVYEDKASNPRAMKNPVIDLSGPLETRYTYSNNIDKVEETEKPKTKKRPRSP